MYITLEDFTKDMQVHYVDSISSARCVVDKLSEYSELCADFETSGLDQHTGVPWLLGIAGVGSPDIYVFDVQRCSESGLWNKESSLFFLKDLLEKRTLLGADIKFDLKWFRKLGIRPRKVYDVIIAGRVLTTGRNIANALTALTERNLGFPLVKETRSSFIMHPEVVKRLRHPPKWTQEQLRYAALDVYCLGAVREKQLADIEREELDAVLDLENKLVPVVADMEYVGLYVDPELWAEIGNSAVVNMNDAYARACKLLAKACPTQISLLSEETGSDYYINLDSAPEMKRRFAALGYKIDSADKKALAGIKHPAAQAVREYRDAEKVVSTYGKEWIGKTHPITHRIHASFNQLQAASGRFSSSNPNMQNVPADEKFRRCFKPAPGCVMIGGDFSQVELRIIAEIADDTNMKAVVHAGGDLHSQTAAILFGKPLEECGPGSIYRRRGKGLNFALL